MTPVPRMQLVYFPLNLVAGAETPFPMVENLIGDVDILGIVAYNNDQLSLTPDLANVVPVGDAVKLTVTLNKGSDQIYKDVPYTDIIRAENAGIWYETEPFPIDLTKCRVKANAAIAGGPFNVAFLFIYRVREPR